MNFGRGFSIPVQNGNQKKDYCNPVAPENPIPVRSNSTPIDMQGNHLGRSNWQDLLGIYSEILQGATNFTEAAVPNLNPIGLTNQNGCLCSRDSPAEKNSGFSLNGDSIVQHFGNDIGGGNGIHSQELLIMNHAASMTSANGLPHDKNSNTCNISVPMSYSQVESHWPDSNFARPSHANNIRASDYRINAHSLQQQMPKDGFQVPYQPNFNLNSPPRSETDAAERISTSFQHAAVTPEEGKQLENHQPSETPNFSVHESSYLEKGDQDKLIASIRNEATGNHCDELLQKIADSSAAAIYTTLEDNMNSQGGIELNKELQQKPPKRRKHRPKVVVEGKPQRTPKPTAPENTSNENPSGTRKYVRKKDLQASPTQQEDVMNEITVDKKASGKRKYVRKKGLQASATQHEDIMNEITVTNIKSEAKSCRIALNIELENETGDQGRDRNSSQVEMHQESRRSFNLNLDSQATDVCTGIYSASTKSALQIEQHNGYIAENQQARILRNFTHTANQMPAEYISLSEQIAAKAPPATMKDHTLNVIERNVNMRNADRCQSSSKNGYNQVHQHVPRRGKCQIVLQENTSTSLNKTRAQMLHSTTQLLAKDIANFDEQRGSNREHCQSTEQTYPRTVNFTGSSLLCQEMSDAGDYTNQGSNYGTGGSETRKKRKIDNKFHGTVLRMPSGNAAVKDCLQVGKRSITVVNSSSSTQIDGQSWKSYFEKDNASKKLNNGVNGAAGNSYFHSMAAEQNILKKHASSELHLSTRMEDKMSQQPTQAHDPNLLSATPPRKVPIADHLQGIETFHANMSTKNQSADPTSKQAPRKDKKLLQEHKDVQVYQKISMKTRGPLEMEKYPVSIDEITHRLERLYIHIGNNEVAGKEQSALVPYKGDGTIVPYEELEPIKKRRLRPKVDLDPETNRIWNFLMEQEGSENTGATDKDKEKWWEQERRVLHGRVDSFIARMHLVQGDRRFSKWKGSVVDSVIGVFLTQNVSDHLSSSAFMSLAAKFPLQSTSISHTRYLNGTTIVVEEPDIQLLGPGGTIKYQEKIARQPICSQSSVTSCEISEHRTDNLTSRTRVSSSANEHNMRAEENVSSSQISFDCFTFQATEDIRSSSGSNSEAVDQIGCKPNKNCSPTLNNFLQTEKTDAFEEFYSHVIGSPLSDERHLLEHQQSANPSCIRQNSRMGGSNNLNISSPFTCPIDSKISHMQGSAVPSINFWLSMLIESGAPEIEQFKESGEDNIFSLLSTASGNTKATGEYHVDNRMGHMAESNIKHAAQQNKMSRLQASTAGPIASLSKRSSQGNLQSGSRSINNQHSVKNHQEERFKSFHQESTSITEPLRRAEELAKRTTGSRQQLSVERRNSAKYYKKLSDNNAIGANAKGKIYSLGEPINGEGANISNARKRKAEGKKIKAFDWDTLRNQVQSSGGRRIRSKDTMDSLDYEAIRRADVNEISNVIKKRGMNKMLADRMKDFLDRLVREHRSIDLEWLRDVPPDKAKDYLLSIRGLGLKSVECVRLLTLHHLAFPVDTNVGRIAVRLGWVPLQPLPESLQLHLLELYPVLESIQKYLWPRLCKLDQRTLYELHYQMITFGKVFCTKSKPNCNACPMRGECRHFASAFASARLALPGPEERSILSSTVPTASDEYPAVVLRHMLPPAESNLTKEEEFINGRCEPIVEQPTTPEQAIEISQSDIEDAFYEDPDEIPTIKLNLEEFTLNLQNYMQENNMELQEGNLSKAIVTLNPEAASIPTPKLKNVSQLRTEHQVYELPESHPLLKGLDRRERDDPSPYLLAIWTPGETANSIQAPENSCNSQARGNLCNEKTCFACNSIREAHSQTVRGTLLIPCRTAMRGSFPLNGTYFQVNEMFADHESSLNPIDVPRAWIWNLPRRTVYFGTSVSTIFRGLSTEGIQYCFWRGFVCVRGFDRKTRAPRPLMARLHFPASKLAKAKKMKRNRRGQ